MGARELLVGLSAAGLSVAADGDRLVIRPASKLTDPMRAALREVKVDLLALLTNRASDLAAVAWTDTDIARFLDRRARLMRWGWTEAEAEMQADRLVRRDREYDDRVSCVDCQHYEVRRCRNHRRAALQSAEVGREFAEVLQRCPGFAP